MNKTAVQWLIDNLEKFEACKDISWRCYVEIHEALRMEREQHAKTWDTALDKYEVRAGNYMRAYEDFDDYYKISDEEALNLAKELNKQPMVDSQFTISDDVLFEQATVAMEEIYGSGCETEIDAYFRGAKWILKQFKK